MAEASRNRKDEQGSYPLNWFSGYFYVYYRMVTDHIPAMHFSGLHRLQI